MFSKQLSPSTLKQYERTITKLNGNVIPTSPNFLKDTAKIETLLDGYSPNSKKTFYITIISYLKDKKIPKKTLQYYTQKMNESNKFFEDHAGEKTEKQIANWISWDEVMDIHAKMKAELPKKPDENNVDYLILSLFTLQPPRRAKDYYLMKVVPAYHEDLPKDFNYLDWKAQKFYFNNYKCKGAYGQQIIDVSPDLMQVLKQYFKSKKDTFFLLFKQRPQNDITRILNKIFQKNVSVSMLRNIYLTSRYADQKTQISMDARKMGTSSSIINTVYTKA
jgi:hypothetical protein